MPWQGRPARDRARGRLAVAHDRNYAFGAEDGDLWSAGGSVQPDHRHASKALRGSPDCRMIESNVPIRTSP